MKTDKQIILERAKQYGPVKEQMEVIGTIQGELFKYCLDRNNSNPSKESLAHLSAMDMVIVKMVRSISNPIHEDNYQDARNYITIAEGCVNNRNG